MPLFLSEVGNVSLNTVRALDLLVGRALDSMGEIEKQIRFTEGMVTSLAELGNTRVTGPYSQQLIALKEQLASEMYLVGQCQTHLGDNRGANNLFRQAVILDREFKNAAIAQGRGHVEVGEYQQAIDVLIEARETAPNDPRLNLFLGCAYFFLRQMDLAQDCFEKVINSISDPNLMEDGGFARASENWTRVASLAVEYLGQIAGWRLAVGCSESAEQDAQRLENLAADRPVFLTTIEGRGWVLSHMVSQIEPFVRQLWLDGVRNPLIIVINPYEFCNPPLVKMYRRNMWLVDDRYPRIRRRLIAAREVLKQRNSPIVADIDRFNPRPHVFNQYVNHLRGWLEAPQILSLSEEQEREGQKLRAKVGMRDQREHVCFAVRESNYYRAAWTHRPEYTHYWEANLTASKDAISIRDELGAERVRGGGPSIVDQRISPLHTPLSNYIQMAEDCAAKGLYVLRMGTNVDEPLPAGLDPKIIDYASEYRSDFGDVYLFATSKFVVAGGTGVIWINAAFGKPFIVTDLYLPNNAVFNTSRDGVPNLYLPRKYWLIEEKRFLTFSESYKVCRFYQHAHNCQADGVENVPNTPDELSAVVDEMNQRIDGVWVDEPEDQDLQDRCRSLLQPYDEGYGLNGRIGAGFLRSNIELLG